jgi:serine/threonine protein phosphatase PrpC
MSPSIRAKRSWTTPASSAGACPVLLVTLRTYGAAKSKNCCMRSSWARGYIRQDAAVLTAEPDITTTEVLLGVFVVLATDGPWDCLTNEEVVGCSFCRQERDQFIYVGHDS